MDLGLLRSLAQPATTKIILCSLDGLGGLPRPGTGKSELETAALPILHALASRSACGLLRHVGPGITPGSGPGHLGLFGYDPLRFPVGRGVLEALGIDFELQGGDVAARGNFCTVDARGAITDRRAGRIGTDLCVRLCERLRTIHLDGVQLLVEPVKEHRFVLVLRGAGLSGRLSETDPQQLGAPPLPVSALAPEAERTAALVNAFVDAARPLLRDKAGEDGDFAAKVAALERFDALLPRVLALRPDVLAISGDHATPSILKGHGWQGVPALISSAYCGDDLVSRFTERDCAGGSLGVMPAQDLMPLLMANALRFTKYGA